MRLVRLCFDRLWLDLAKVESVASGDVGWYYGLWTLRLGINALRPKFLAAWAVKGTVEEFPREKGTLCSKLQGR